MLTGAKISKSSAVPESPVAGELVVFSGTRVNQVLQFPDPMSIAGDPSLASRVFRVVEKKASVAYVPELERCVSAWEAYRDRYWDNPRFKARIARAESIISSDSAPLMWLKEVCENSSSGLFCTYYAEECFQQGLETKALELFEDLASQGSVESSMRLIEIYVSTGKLDLAQDRMAFVELEDPTNHEVYLSSALIAMLKGELRVAISKFRLALKLRGNLASAFYGIALCHLFLEKRSQALLSLHKATSIDPLYKKALALGADLYLEQVHDSHNPRNRLEYFARVFPRDVDITNRLTKIYLVKDELRRGIAFFEDQLKLDNSAVAQNALGVLLWFGRKKKGAIQYFASAVQLANDDESGLEARANLIAALNDLHDYRNAVKYAAPVVGSVDDIQNNIARPAYQRILSGYIHTLIGLEEDSKALGILQSMLDREDLDLNIRIDLLITESWFRTMIKPEFRKAEMSAENAIRILQAKRERTGERVWMAVNNLAYSLIEQGRLEAAENALKNIAGEDSAYVMATRGMLAFRKGLIDKGRVLYQKARNRLGSAEQLGLFEQKALIEEAKALCVTGDFNRAKKLLEKAKRTRGGYLSTRHLSFSREVLELQKVISGAVKANR